MVDCTALERRHVRLGHRGFESLSFRQLVEPSDATSFGFFFIFNDLRVFSVYRRSSQFVGIRIKLMGKLMVRIGRFVEN